MSNRNTSDRRGAKDATIAKELKDLFKNGHTDHGVLSKLRDKYNDDDLINAIFDAYKERQNHLSKKARKFKQLIYDRYTPLGLSGVDIIKKAKKYAKKYDINDAEFDYFVKLAMTDKDPRAGFPGLPNTVMAKTLGYGAIVHAADKLNYKQAELPHLKAILELHGQTRSLHSQIIIQSLTYRDCAPEAITGDYRADKHNVYSHVHPVLAALFLPKIDLIDNHILIANIGGIIKAKNEGRPILTQPDLELYHDLISDPNEHACNSDGPLADLKNRFALQTRIWDSVLNLRQGKYYNDKLQEFLLAIDNCRTNVYDAPDLTYVKDEGAIVRRILSAFAIRPTIVTTTRLWSNFGVGVNANQLSMAGVSNVTTVSMIPLRLPLSLSGRNATAVSIDEAFNQAQWYVENKTIVPKTQSIVHSRDVLFFYVGRRYQNVNITRLNTPYNFTNLPMTVAGWEKLNDTHVNFDHNMNIGEDVFQLRSVVMVERAASRQNLIIGCSAGIIIPRDFEHNRVDEGAILYNPQSAGEKYKTLGYDNPVQPIRQIPTTPALNDTGATESFDSRASTRGTVFIYVKQNRI